MRGRDPRIHAARTAWIAGSSPAMTCPGSADFADRIGAADAEHLHLLAVVHFLTDRASGQISLPVQHAGDRVAELFRYLQHLHGVVAIAVAQLRRDRQRTHEDQSGEHRSPLFLTLAPLQIRCQNEKPGDATYNLPDDADSSSWSKPCGIAAASGGRFPPIVIKMQHARNASVLPRRFAVQALSKFEAPDRRVPP